MNKKKLMISVLSASLVGVVAIGSTLAYLSDRSNEVTNAFNVGSGYVPDGNKHVGLWLDETAKTSTENPTAIDKDNRTEEGVTYEEMLPGSIVAKDPTFHLTTGSTDSYVFAQVTGVDAMIADGYYFTVAKPQKLVDPTESNFDEKWEKVVDAGTDQDAGFDGLYLYKDVVKGGVLGENHSVATAADTMNPVFQWVKLGSEVKNNDFAQITAGSIVIKGVAVQSANLTADEAESEAQKILAEDAGV